MPRTLRHLVEVLDLHPQTIARRTGVDLAELVRTPTDADVLWEIVGHVRTTPKIGGWGDTHRTWNARATLPIPVIPDAEFDVDLNGPRTVESLPLVVASARAWLALELHEDAPEDSSVLYRIRVDGTDYVADAGAWTEAVDPLLDWASKQATEEAFGALLESVPDVRDVQVIAWLSSTGGRPAFFGYSVAYGVRAQGDEDDALVRTLRRALDAGLRVPVYVRATTGGGNGGDPIPLAGEAAYDITGVLAVYDITADPDETTPLAGVFAPATYGKPGTPATWTPDIAVDDDHVLEIEIEIRPLVVAVSRHRDLLEVARVPAVVLTPGEGTTERLPGAGLLEVRNVWSDPPTALTVDAPTLERTTLDVRVLGELAADVRRIATWLRAWLGPAGYRSLVSPETGREVTLYEIDPLETNASGIPQGIVEARGTWLLEHEAEGAISSRVVPLVREGGILITAEEA